MEYINAPTIIFATFISCKMVVARANGVASKIPMPHWHVRDKLRASVIYIGNFDMISAFFDADGLSATGMMTLDKNSARVLQTESR